MDAGGPVKGAVWEIGGDVGTLGDAGDTATGTAVGGCPTSGAVCEISGDVVVAAGNAACGAGCAAIATLAAGCPVRGAVSDTGATIAIGAELLTTTGSISENGCPGWISQQASRIVKILSGVL